MTTGNQFDRAVIVAYSDRANAICPLAEDFVPITPLGIDDDSRTNQDGFECGHRNWFHFYVHRPIHEASQTSALGQDYVCTYVSGGGELGCFGDDWRCLSFLAIAPLAVENAPLPGDGRGHMDGIACWARTFRAVVPRSRETIARLHMNHLTMRETV